MLYIRKSLLLNHLTAESKVVLIQLKTTNTNAPLQQIHHQEISSLEVLLTTGRIMRKHIGRLK